MLIFAQPKHKSKFIERDKRRQERKNFKRTIGSLGVIESQARSRSVGGTANGGSSQADLLALDLDLVGLTAVSNLGERRAFNLRANKLLRRAAVFG